MDERRISLIWLTSNMVITFSKNWVFDVEHIVEKAQLVVDMRNAVKNVQAGL